MLKAQRGRTSMGIRKRDPLGKRIPRKLCLGWKRPAGCCLGRLHLLWDLPQDAQFCTSGRGAVAGVQTGSHPTGLHLDTSGPRTTPILAALKDGNATHAGLDAQEHTERTPPYRVAFCLLLAPFQQSVALGATVLAGQRSQRVSPFHTRQREERTVRRRCWLWEPSNM